MAQMNFDPTQTTPSTGVPDPIPPNDYRLIAKDSAGKDTQTGGKYLVFTFEVIEGPYKGRLVFENFNLVNANPKTVEIAKAQLSALCHAVGKLTAVRDSSELHNLPFIATVGIEPAKNGYPAKNRIKKYHFKDAAGAPATAPSTA